MSQADRIIEIVGSLGMQMQQMTLKSVTGFQTKISEWCKSKAGYKSFTRISSVSIGSATSYKIGLSK